MESLFNKGDVMNMNDVVDGMRVIYLPNHAKDESHPDCQYGMVMAHNNYFAFVKFDDQVGDTNPACDPKNLEPE